MANTTIPKVLKATTCARCTKKLTTGEEYATEKVADTNHRWYHWDCIKNDPDTRKVVKHGKSPYVEYNQASKKF